MNIDKVNSVLSRAINHFQACELEDMQETIDELAVDESSGSETLNSYIHTVVTDARKAEASEDDDEIIDAMLDIAEAATESGKLPSAPSLDEEDEEGWTKWVEAATEAELGAATIQLLQKRAEAA
jgi:hypothetical protein